MNNFDCPWVASNLPPAFSLSSRTRDSFTCGASRLLPRRSLPGPTWAGSIGDDQVPSHQGPTPAQVVKRSATVSGLVALGRWLPAPHGAPSAPR